MKPYKSGKYVVGNHFLIDLSTGQVSFHCRSSMRMLANSLPPDEPGRTEPSEPDRPLTDADRLAVFAPAMLVALAKAAPAAGCIRAQDDPFWGTGLEETAPAPLPSRTHRPWTDHDEALYQAANMYECAAYHWYEGQ